MRVLIVKLSSLGDVVHAMPVVHDLRAARPDVVIDWVVEPGFAPLVRRVDGIGRVIDCALRRWTRAWWTAPVRREWQAFRARLGESRYDAVFDLQGLTKSALVGRLARMAPGGLRYGLANRTDGASHEPPARWLVDRAIRIDPHVHALDRSRRLVAAALGTAADGPPVFGLRAAPERAAGDGRPTLAFVHGSSRADKLWPEADWIDIGRRAVGAGWRIALPRAGDEESARAARIAAALPAGAATVWPSLPLDAVVDRLAGCDGVIGVDSGLSHIAVALGLPHVQVYNWPTAWRTGPLVAHGHRQQLSVESNDPSRPVPSVDSVWEAWRLASSAGPDDARARRWPT